MSEQILVNPETLDARRVKIDADGTFQQFERMLGYLNAPPRELSIYEHTTLLAYAYHEPLSEKCEEGWWKIRIEDCGKPFNLPAYTVAKNTKRLVAKGYLERKVPGRGPWGVRLTGKQGNDV